MCSSIAAVNLLAPAKNVRAAKLLIPVEAGSSPALQTRRRRRTLSSRLAGAAKTSLLMVGYALIDH